MIGTVLSLIGIELKLWLRNNKKTYEEIETFNFKLGQTKDLDLFAESTNFPLTIFSKETINTKRKDPNFWISGESIQNTLEEQNISKMNQGNSSLRKIDSNQQSGIYK